MKLKRRKALGDKAPWTPAQEEKLLSHLKKRAGTERIMKDFPSRSLASVRSKIRKMRIHHDIFGDMYREDKIIFTTEIAKKTKPVIVFEAYAGVGHQTFAWLTHANCIYASEIKKNKTTQLKKNLVKNGFTKRKSLLPHWDEYDKGAKKVFVFTGDAVDAAVSLHYHKIKPTLIDLDTCGSTIPTLPLFLSLLKPRNLVITHGEFHSMRFKREDVLRRLFFHADVSKNPLPISVDNMSRNLDEAVKVAALRSANETKDSSWLVLKNETWLGGKFHGMLRRHYIVTKPAATADCLNALAS